MIENEIATQIQSPSHGTIDEKASKEASPSKDGEQEIIASKIFQMPSPLNSEKMKPFSKLK